MPLYDFQCKDCQKSSELLLISSAETPVCSHCGSRNMTKLLSAHSSLSGCSNPTLPGPNDTACCGSTPSQADGCAGPGSCCGKAF